MSPAEQVSPWFVLATVLVIAAVTYLLRGIPFLVLSRLRDSPVVAHLGRTMPLGVMVVLVVYALPDIDFTRAPFGLPELAALAVTIGLHLWRRNVALSLLAGTGTYVALLALTGG